MYAYMHTYVYLYVYKHTCIHQERERKYAFAKQPTLCAYAGTLTLGQT